MGDGSTRGEPLVELIRLEGAARAAREVRELAFVILNETHRLVPYRQAFLCRKRGRRLRLEGVSGLARVERASPFHDWFQSFLREVDPGDGLTQVDPAKLSERVRAGWEEWLPPVLVAVALRDTEESALAVLFLAREEPLELVESELLRVLASAYGHALGALTGRRSALRSAVEALAASRWWLGLIAAAVPLLFIPVRQSSLGPAEVTPLASVAVTSPLDGVVAEVHVKPNQAVEQGQVLLRLDDTTIRNRQETARRALEVAETEAHLTQQKAFADPQARGEIATQKARVREKATAIQYLSQLAAKLEVRTPSSGVVLFGDPTDWEGKPVTMGERIMTVADERSAGITAWIPVADAVGLDPGCSLRLFLHVDPLRPLEATVLRSSYQPVLSPDGIASYRVTAELKDPGELPRLGLRGTAKVYGPQVRLAYYLFRRPLAAARQFLGY